MNARSPAAPHRPARPEPGWCLVAAADGPCVVVHGLADARLALAPGLPVTLLSAPAAASFAGAGWWRALVVAACAGPPRAVVRDLLDCGQAPGHALEALAAGQRALVLEERCPAFALVESQALALGARLLGRRPRALDLARPGAAARLEQWLLRGETR